MTLVERQQQRGNLVEQMRKLLDKAGAEKRALTAEETQEYDRLDAEQEQYSQEIAREERLVAVERQLERRPDPTVRPTPEDAASRAEALARVPEGFRSYIARASADVQARWAVWASPEYARAFQAYLLGDAPPPEIRQTLQMDLFTKGGALVPPLEFIAELIKAVDDVVFVRGVATRRTVTMAEGLGAPSLDTDPADADWTSELAVGSQATMAFGRRELRPHPLAKWIKVSNKLMRASVMDPEGIVRDRLAYKFGITLEKAYLTGDGTQKPLGVFTASADGIPTGRDVSTGNSATDIGADGLIEAKHAIKSQYWPRLRWAFHRDGVKRIRKLKDGNGQYLWAPGLSGDLPDRILEVPYVVSEYVPNTFTTGLYVGIIGDWSTYWIVDALDLTIQRLVELYAATNETGFIGRFETDGAPVLSEAWARVTLA